MDHTAGKIYLRQPAGQVNCIGGFSDRNIHKRPVKTRLVVHCIVYALFEREKLDRIRFLYILRMGMNR